MSFKKIVFFVSLMSIALFNNAFAEGCANNQYLVDGNTCRDCPASQTGWVVFAESGATSIKGCYIKKRNKVSTNSTCVGSIKIYAQSDGTYTGNVDYSDLSAKAGYFINRNGINTTCDLCPSGQISSGGRDIFECTSCPSGVTNDAHTGCLECNEIGTYVENGFCKDCPLKKDRINNIYSFLANETADKNISGCKIKLVNGKCMFSDNPNKTTNVIYTYSESDEAYVLNSGSKIALTATSIPVSTEDIKTKVTTKDDFQDFCMECTGETPFAFYDEKEKTYRCSTCDVGSCIENKVCKPCPAGKACNVAGQTCDAVDVCPKNTFSEEGATQCTKCATSYTTIYSGPSTDNYCLEEGEGCMSASACKMIKPKLCLVPGCNRCTKSREDTLDAIKESNEVNNNQDIPHGFNQGGSNSQQIKINNKPLVRGYCGISLFMGDHIKTRAVNNSVLQKVPEAPTDWWKNFVGFNQELTIDVSKEK